MKYFYFLVVSALIFSTASCRRKGCTDPTASNYDEKAKKDDGSCQYSSHSGHHLLFQFSHNYDGTAVSSADFNDLKFTNQAGNVHSISKLDYLISDIRLYKSNGDSIVFEGYQFVNLSDANTMVYAVTEHVPADTYTGIGFNFGFDAADNTSGTYTDLNAASWSWPGMLGGGYHFMKFEGKFLDSISDTTNFAYHMGTAREITMVDTVFHENHFLAQLPNSSFTLSNDASIEIKMNISEWFKTPNSWDLNSYNSTLMPNYGAQIMMNQNGQNTFTLGTISQ